MNRAKNKEVIREQALKMFTEELDRKLRRMKEGKILDLLFNIEIISERKLRETNEYREWRENVLDRDERKCQECGATKKLHVHHIYPFRFDPMGKGVDINNGKTLCQECHANVHREKWAKK